ncbi:MAG: ABC transporter ATP-binding protein [Pseudomonadota bacterium]
MAVESQGLTKRYGSHVAVHDVSLRVPDGAVYAMLGTNGAGKTTTLRMLVDVITPDAGVARVNGTDSRSLRRADLLSIGYVSESQKLPERLTVAQYFDYVRRLYENWDSGLERTLRQQFDLPPERRIGKLSHGMRMKTLLASALAYHPSTLILDEPLSGLDPLTRDQVVDGLLRQTDGATTIISSHEISEIESFASHVGFMDRGELLFQDDSETLQGRFREISVVLPTDRELPADLPPSWIGVEQSQRSVRFVETAFESHDASLRQLGGLLGPVRIEPAPLSLRDITTALMRDRQVRNRQ